MQLRDKIKQVGGAHYWGWHSMVAEERAVLAGGDAAAQQNQAGGGFDCGVRPMIAGDFYEIQLSCKKVQHQVLVIQLHDKIKQVGDGKAWGAHSLIADQKRCSAPALVMQLRNEIEQVGNGEGQGVHSMIADKKRCIPDCS
eukprot:scaffold318032_cov18-Tisochrysis_lutea.AAC.1